MAEIERVAVDTSSIKGIPIIWIMGKTEIFFSPTIQWWSFAGMAQQGVDFCFNQ